MTLSRETARRLILILGDQLSPSMSSLRGADPTSDVVLMCEVDEECTYAPHHKKKIAFILSAMRHFAEEMREAGWSVDYVTLTDSANTGSILGELDRAVTRWSPRQVVITEPGEWRLFSNLDAWSAPSGCTFDMREDDRFMCSHARFRDWRRGRKTLRMEHFYRMMRRETGILIKGGKPAGGRWNFDAENRKPADRELTIPCRRSFTPDPTTSEVLALVEEQFPDAFGDLHPFLGLLGFGVKVADADREENGHRVVLPGERRGVAEGGAPFEHRRHVIAAGRLDADAVDRLQKGDLLLERLANRAAFLAAAGDVEQHAVVLPRGNGAKDGRVE